MQTLVWGSSATYWAMDTNIYICSMQTSHDNAEIWKDLNGFVDHDVDLGHLKVYWPRMQYH